MLRPTFDADLIERYGGEGPRYTSDPTALQFSDTFSPQDWISALEESNRLPIPADLSLYVHVPFCSSPCFYCGCNRVITRSALAGQEFLAQLEQEVMRVSQHIDRDRQVRQLHLGGGTPTFLSSAQLDQLLQVLRSYFHFDTQAELGLEVDPRTVTPEDIRALAKSGFNRISIGIQDFDPNVQKAVNRVHDAAQVERLIRTARAVGFESISVDLIYGLPLQTTAAFADTVEQIIRLRPDRISLFNYAHMPHLFKAQNRISADDLPSSANKLAIFRNTLSRLLDAGYEFIGMDHFALPDDALARARRDGTMMRNFQGYSTHAGLDLIGLGPSAISQVNESFAQNHRLLSDWKQGLRNAQLPIARGLTRSTEDEMRAGIINSIMCSGGLRWRDYELEYEISFSHYFDDEIKRLCVMADDGLIEWVDGGFDVTSAGLLFVRAVAMVFDEYLARREKSVRKFSRIV